MEICEKMIKKGMTIRYIATVVTFYLLSLNTKILKYKYLILPIVLTFLDEVDNIFTIFYKYNGKYNSCTKLFYYQYTDKIYDSISYLLLYAFFKLDFILLMFIFYRIIGVILFYYTKNSRWLILFFDFAKEYLIYLFVFGNNFIYLPFFVSCKICFEYYYHTMHNKNKYST